MGYSKDPEMVRVDFFKSESGKWYTTEAVKWTGEWLGNGELIHDAFAKSLRDHLSEFNNIILKDMDAVCIHPYHEYEHPLCIRKGNWR